MFLSDVSIKRPVFATMMMLTLVVLGVVAYQRLAIDEYPDIVYPIVMVNTPYPGASPEVMMQQVARPIEQAVNTVQGIKEVTSTSMEGSAMVRVTLQLGVDVMSAQQDVQAKVARIRRSLPPNVEEPVVSHFDPNDSPIMTLSVRSAERAITELTDLADQSIVPRLEAVPGVGAVNRSGGNSRVIRVELDPNRMRAYGVSAPEVMRALQRENQEVPAGRIYEGISERLVRVTGKIVDPLSFANVAVAVRNGVPIKVSDLGTVIDGTADRRNAAELNREPAISIDILKISGANTVEVADSVRAAVTELAKQMPVDVQLQVNRDDSRRIRESLADVQLTIVLGAVLTIGIIYLFLNSWRSTVITGLALPISIISSFFIMWAMNFTMNTMTLLALSLAIGLLIDDAIVVRENIVRHMEMGKDHYKAAMDGTSEIGLAVFSTTMAVVAVFVPVAFMGGMIGRIFFQFGVTVAFAVIVSLFVSFTLDPMLSSVWYDPEVEHGGAKGATERLRTAEMSASGALFPTAPAEAGGALIHQGPTGEASMNQGHASGALMNQGHTGHTARTYKKPGPVRRFAIWFNHKFELLSDRYPRALAWALKHRVIVMAGALASVALALYIIPTLPFTWMPDADADEFSVNFRTTPGSSLPYTLGKGRQVSEMLRQRKDVVFTYLSVGGGFRGGPNAGSVFVRLKPKGEGRDLTLMDIQTELRAELRKIPGIRPSIQGQGSIFGGRRSPIIINVQGPEETRLKLAAAKVLDIVRAVPGIAEPQSSEEGDIPQLDVRVDRQLAWAAGVGVEGIGATLQPLFTGQRATRWEDPQGYQHDVIVVYPDSLRTSAADVAEIPVPSNHIDPATGRAVMIPLSQVAEVHAGVGPQQIERRSLERQVSISANVLPGYGVGDVADEVRAQIERAGLPPGYHAVFTGDVQNLEETKGYIGGALVLAVVFIYLILASLFGSFLQPLAIMLALPLSLIGVALALLWTNGSMNVMTMIGIIMLMGLVTKNGILLVDFTNHERERGEDRTTAILTAGRTRLRPIIMTTVAMIFGMIPLALAIGAGAEQRAPMARAVIGGLLTSTILTLFVVPVMYTLLDDLATLMLRRTAGTRGPVEHLEPEPAVGD